MTPEEVEDFVREGDVVVVKATVLEILASGAVRTHSVHPASAIRFHERRFLPGDLVRNRAGAGSIAASWRIVHVNGDMAWIEAVPTAPGNRGFIWNIDDLVHAMPETRVDNNPSA